MNILYLIAFYFAINIFGFVLEKIKIPKIYAALFLGIFLSNSPLIKPFTSSLTTNYLSLAGMFSLLFLLGYGLDINKIKSQSSLILKITSSVILSESIIGITILHYFFGVDWLISIIIAISFSTVGEVALLPILKEFNLLKSSLGQTILGVAILDDVIEILAFIFMITFLTGLNLNNLINEIIPLAAIILGIIVNHTLKNKKKISKYISFLALIVFGPVFFFTAGTEANLSLLISDFPKILLFTLTIKVTKILSTYLSSHKQLGTKKSIIAGVSLGIKFSTSIVILIILLNSSLITEELFSILLGIKIIFKVIVPILLSFLLTRWKTEVSN